MAAEMIVEPMPVEDVGTTQILMNHGAGTNATKSRSATLL